MDMEVVVKLLLAHILGDFFLQTRRFCEIKKERSFRGIAASGCHAFLVAILSYALVADWSCWWIPLIILFSHWLIDVCKSLQKIENAAVFIIDQLAHLTVIAILSYFYTGCPKIEWSGFSVTGIIYLLSYLLVMSPSSVMIKLFTQQWTPKGVDEMSLPNAGKWIGYLERILILTFIYSGHVEGIGFLLAAKSIFRFGDLNKSKDVRTTEYVLLGTFMSFAISILIGFVVVYIS